MSTCTHCNANFSNGYLPGYCSESCYYKRQGDNILRHIEQDPRICASCFRLLKEIDRPADAPECVVGIEYLTNNAIAGETLQREIPRIVDRTVMCACGSQHDDDYLRGLELKDTLKHFIRIFKRLHSEGQHDKTLHVETLCKNLAKNHDWDEAIGRAIES